MAMLHVILCICNPEFQVPDLATVICAGDPFACNQAGYCKCLPLGVTQVFHSAAALGNNYMCAVFSGSLLFIVVCSGYAHACALHAGVHSSTTCDMCVWLAANISLWVKLGSLLPWVSGAQHHGGAVTSLPHHQRSAACQAHNVRHP